MTETETFICAIRKFCAQTGMNPVAFLAVRLFETGGTLSARYLSDSGAFGLLQWTPLGIQPLGLTKSLPGRSNKEVFNFLLKSRQNRFQQLIHVFMYHHYWIKAIKTDPVTSKSLLAKLPIDSIEFAYQITLYPTAPSTNYKEGKNPTITEIIYSANFKAYLVQAKGMLEGTVGVPNHEDGLVLSGAHHAAYVKRVGTSLVNPSSCNISLPLSSRATSDSTNNSESSAVAPTTPPPPLSDTKNESAQPDLNALYPVECIIKIPEFPRFVGLRAGDTIILAHGQFKDWLVTSVQRSFEQGINQLQITARRPLNPAPFINASTSPPKDGDWLKYYWLFNK